MNIHDILARGSQNADCYTHARVWITKNEQLAGEQKTRITAFCVGPVFSRGSFCKGAKYHCRLTKTRFIRVRVLIILI